ncbi:YopX family protein [Enterococcus faecalis]|uniref:YopX family protein n=1 Tax=Enterococcus faecalis TaxID=1351 RepID=UPI000F8002D7|nr:YopX family protein [Enterococcus faecalis]RTK82662.1 DNA-packaging protein [Enterococcus faecalis]
MIPKFRAWDKRENTMRDVAVLHFTKGGKVNSIEYWKTPSELKSYHVRNLVLMQSTGLKDKNGVEIFEGDIVQYRDGEYSYLGIVKRDCYQFFIDGIEPDDNYDFIDVSNTFDGTSSLEVIGNIWDNPELLEVAE